MTKPFSFPFEVVQQAQPLELAIAGNSRLKTKVPVLEKANMDEVVLAARMLKTMYTNSGVGLAGNQVIVPRPIRGVAFDPLQKKLDNGYAADPHFIFNPEIVEAHEEYEMEEGCLSFPSIFLKKKRFARIIVRGKDHEWNDQEIEAIGVTAVILQHEIDHLNGKTFVDDLSFLKRATIARKVKKFTSKS